MASKNLTKKMASFFEQPSKIVVFLKKKSKNGVCSGIFKRHAKWRHYKRAFGAKIQNGVSVKIENALDNSRAQKICG